MASQLRAFCLSCLVSMPRRQMYLLTATVLPLYSAQDLSCRVVVKKYTLIPLLPCVFDCALLCVTEEKCMRIDLSQYTQG